MAKMVFRKLKGSRKRVSMKDEEGQAPKPSDKDEKTQTGTLAGLVEVIESFFIIQQLKNPSKSEGF